MAIVAAIGAAIAVGRWIGWQQSAKSSLMTEPASAPARQIEADEVEPVRPDEAETAEESVQSARHEEIEPIRADGPAATAGGGAADGSHDALLELVTSESRLVTMGMAAELAALRAELAASTERIRRLSVALAEAQAALDRNEVRRAQALEASVPRPVDAPVEARLVDVNPELGLVVLDRGARQGVRYGLALTVLRDRRRVARVRVVDVRENVSGAAIEEIARGDHPQTGDRAVLTSPAGP